MEVEQAVFIVARDKNQFIIKSWCFEWENVYNLLFFSTFPCGEGGVWLHDEYVTDFFFFFFFLYWPRWLCRGRQKMCMHKDCFVLETHLRQRCEHPKIVILLWDRDEGTGGKTCPRKTKKFALAWYFWMYLFYFLFVLYWQGQCVYKAWWRSLADMKEDLPFSFTG